MKILLKNIVKDPVTGSYSLASRNTKHKMDPEDYFFELPKTTRFRKDPEERHTYKQKHRVKNPFKDVDF